MKAVALGTGTALVVLSLVPPAGMAGSERLDLRSARPAARAAVQAHTSYRVIHRPSRLHVRSCWRVSRRTVRCSFEVTVGYRCELDGPPPPDKLCAAVTGRRRWVVQVRARAGGRKPVARVLAVSSSEAAARA